MALGRTISVLGSAALAAGLLGACDAPRESAAAQVAASGLQVMPMTVAGERFEIELAYEAEDIILGLGQRRELDPRGGMIFIFPEPAFKSFVMRDCYIPIDIAFLDSRGTVITVHSMAVEEPQRPGESERDYNLRLEQYPSRYRATYALETLGGTWEEIGLKVGDQVVFDAEYLKSLAR